MYQLPSFFFLWRIALISLDLGPLHVSPVNRAGSIGFRDLASPLFPSLKFRCVHMRGRADPVTEISVFATEISVTGMKIFPYEHSSPGDRDETFLTK